MDRKELVGVYAKALIASLRVENMAIGATLNDEGNPIPCIVDFETNTMYSLNYDYIGHENVPESGGEEKC